MPNRIISANGAETVQRTAAAEANTIQDACNLVAIVGVFHRHLLALQRSGTCGDELINHPVSIAFASKLNSLCQMSPERESEAFDALNRLQRGEVAEYEVLPIKQIPTNHEETK